MKDETKTIRKHMVEMKIAGKTAKEIQQSVYETFDKEYEISSIRAYTQRNKLTEEERLKEQAQYMQKVHQELEEESCDCKNTVFVNNNIVCDDCGKVLE